MSTTCAQVDKFDRVKRLLAIHFSQIKDDIKWNQTSVDHFDESIVSVKFFISISIVNKTVDNWITSNTDEIDRRRLSWRLIISMKKIEMSDAKEWKEETTKI